MQNEIQTLKTIFDSNNIPVSLEWLTECINWCKSEVLNPNYTLDQLKNSIHDQWLNLDLRDIETKVLPPSLSDKKLMILNGNFSLQVMKVVDISKPKYWQLQQIRKQNVLTRPTANEEKETIGSGKRVLQLTLTDGVQFVEAMEYKPIQSLNINLTPGIKIRLSGPITIRRGRLLLEEKNVRILGGEVEELLISNAAENVLASALNLPLNENPNTIDMQLLTVQGESENKTHQNSIKEDNKRTQQPIPKVTTLSNNESKETNRNHYSMASTIRQDDFPTDEDMEMLMAQNHFNKVTAQTTPCNQIGQSAKEPTDEEMELLMEMENEHVRNNRSTINKTPDLFDDDFDPDQIDHLLEASKDKEKIIAEKNTKEVCSNLTTSTNKRNSSTDPNPNSPKRKKGTEENNIDTSLFEDFVNEDLFADLDLDILKKENGKPEIITVKDIQTKITNGCVGSFRIKAKFKAIEKKVTVVSDEFKAQMRITDGTGDLVCQVHSEVISKWAGITPVQMLDLRKNILAGKVEFKNKVQSILKVIMNKILDVDNVMEIRLNGDGSSPLMREIFY